MSTKPMLTPEQKAKARCCLKRSMGIASPVFLLPWFIYSDSGDALSLSIFGGLFVFFITYFAHCVYFKIPWQTGRAQQRHRNGNPWPTHHPNNPNSISYIGRSHDRGFQDDFYRRQP